MRRLLFPAYVPCVPGKLLAIRRKLCYNLQNPHKSVGKKRYNKILLSARQTENWKKRGAGELKKKRYLWLLLIPVAAIVILCMICGSFALNFSGADVVSLLSDNPAVSVVELLALYVLKTCSIMFPLGALQVASGMIYSLPVALLVNLAGLVIIVTIPFVLGKKTTPELQRKLIQRFPKLQRVENFQNRTPFTYCFLLRVVCVVPGDLLSWYLGTTGLDYRSFVLGTVLGKLTGMVLFTLLGANLTARAGWQFWCLWGVLLVANFLVVKVIEWHVTPKNATEKTKISGE